MLTSRGPFMNYVEIEMKEITTQKYMYSIKFLQDATSVKSII